MTLDNDLPFSTRLRVLRTLRNLQVKKMALALGIHKVSLSKIERGLLRPSAGLRQRCAELLGDARLATAPWVERRPDNKRSPEATAASVARLRQRAEASLLKTE